MTPKEIVERVRYVQSVSGHMATHETTDISHLLAIHAAVVEYLDAFRAYEIAMMEAVLISDNEGKMQRTFEARAKAHSNLAALCGWTAKESP